MQYFHDFETDVSFIEPDYKSLYFYAKAIIEAAYISDTGSSSAVLICQRGKETLDKMEQPTFYANEVVGEDDQ